MANPLPPAARPSTRRGSPPSNQQNKHANKPIRTPLVFWLLASVLLHVFLLGGAHYWDSFGARFTTHLPQNSYGKPVQIGFVTEPPATPEPAVAVTTKPVEKSVLRRPTQKPKPVKPNTPSLEATASPANPESAQPELGMADLSDANLAAPKLGEPQFGELNDRSSVFTASDVTTDTPPFATAEAPEPTGPPEGKIEITRLPPPVRLEYDLIFTKEGSNLSGTGRLSWQYNNNGYLADISAHAFIQVFRMTSQGKFVLGAGLMPVRQTEQRALRSETAVNFNWEKTPPQISFSTRTDSLPLSPGTQDYASVIMQLASLLASETVNQTPSIQPGAVVQFTVADTRQVRTINFVVNDDGIVATPYGKFAAWRFSYLPPSDSYERSIEFWFARELHWLPIKIRYADVRRNQVYELLLKGREWL